VQMNDGELVGHTPDLVMALYMAHKRLQSDHLASSSTDLRYGRDERSQERERKDRETRRDLKGSAVGDAILQEQDRRQERW
jgi:hypothetical protein